MKKRNLLAYFSLIICLTSLKAQTLSVNDTVSPNDLITDLITSGDICSTVLGVDVANDGSGQSVNSYGSFTASNNMDFNLTEGIVLTTGTAVNAGIAGSLNIQGQTTNWPGSALYENAVGLPAGTSYNATEVEFSFLALKNDITIDYVFASEEYANVDVCTSQEGVVILIKESGAADDTYVNVATIPGTSTPITVSNIHEEIISPACNASNESYLGGARGSNTLPNYSQYTTTLQAQTNTVINTEYTVKIIIADQEDGNFDSAVFVGPIDNEQEIDFSATFVSDSTIVSITDKVIDECGQGVVLQLDTVYPSSYTFEWYKDSSTTPLSGENSNNLTVSSSGAYKVRVSQSIGCYSEETIVVNLSQNQPGNDLLPMNQCVATGGSAFFNLTERDAAANAGRTSAPVYSSNLNGTISDANKISYNGVDGEVISVTITESSGCIYTSTFTLNVSTNGAFFDSNSYTYTICDIAEPAFNDGFETVFLNEIQSTLNLPVISSPESYTFYDHTNSEITNGRASTFTSNTNGYAPFRIEYSDGAGCTSSAELLIIVNQPPSIVIDLEYIEVCDVGIDSVDRDGVANFDMSTKLAELDLELTSQGNSNYTIEFYPSILSAVNAVTSEIIPEFPASVGGPSISNYNNDPAYTEDFVQVIAVRIEDNLSGCYAIEQLQLRPRYLMSNTVFQDESICDADGDGIEVFDLDAKRTEIVNGNNYEASLFRSFAEAEANSNEITVALFENETVDTQTLWVRIEDLDTGCIDYDEEIATFDLIVNEKPTINEPSIKTLTPICDPGTDGQVTGLFDYFTQQIGGEYTAMGITVSYFDYQPDPLNVNTLDAITNSYTNVADTVAREYWVIGLGNDSGCYSEPKSFFLQVNSAPVVDNTNPDVILVCYDGSGVIPVIDIEENKDVIIADQINNTIAYYETEADAIVGEDQGLIDLVAGDEFTSTVDTSIWYRIQNVSTGCPVIVEQPIIVNTIPVIAELEDFSLCVDAGVSAGFLLSSRDAEILGTQTDKVVRYFTTESLAIGGAIGDEIDKDIPFDTNVDIDVFVRVENTDDTDCYNVNDIQSFVLNVAEKVNTVAAPNPAPSCGLFGIAVFDLKEIENSITNNGSIVLESIKFYENLNDARGSTVPLSPNEAVPDAVAGTEIIDIIDNDISTLLYSNTSSPLSQRIHVRIESVSGCVTFDFFDLLVRETPVVEDIPSLIGCDIDGDEEELVDLTQIKSFSFLDFTPMQVDITDLNDVDLTYFTSEAGRDTYMMNTASTLDKISAPSSFLIQQITAATPIFIVINTSTCSYATEFNVVLDPLPVITPVPVIVCEDALGSNEFTIDLDILNDDFEFYKGNDADVELNYFTDAAGTIPVSGSFVKTTNISAIYLQAVNTRTTCVSDEVIEITLTANPLPTITAPTTLEAVTCDTDGVNDGVTVFALSSLNNIVLGVQSTTDFLVTYYDSANIEMTDLSSVSNGETYTAVITNANTGCQNSTDFMFTVNQLPEIQVLNTVDFCDDDEVTTNTITIDLTEVITQFSYVTSAQAQAIDMGGIKFYSDSLRTSEITLPTAYSKSGSTNEIIYLDLISVNDCAFQTEFSVQISPKPVIDFDSAKPLVFCEDTFGTGQYTSDLMTDIASQVLDDPSKYTVTFHSDITATTANQITSPHITGDAMIFIKVISAIGCENIEPITIEVAPIPVVNPVSISSRTICDTDGDNDGFLVYDFNIFNAEVLGTQSDVDYSITYHETEQGAIDNVIFNLVEITSETYYVKLQNRTTLCFDIAPIIITVNTLPEIDGEEILFCENNPARLYDKFTGNRDDTYLWEFTGGRTSETTAEISFSFADVGSTATLTVTNSVTGCSNSEDFEIKASPTPDIKPIVTKNFDTDEAIIEVTEQGDYLYALTKTRAIPEISEAQESNVFTGVLPGKYYAHVIDLNGCGDVEPIEVSFVDYYPYFTPNGSGPVETETWHIQAIEEIPGTVVFIYDRFGVLMHTVSSGSPGWDGTHNGSPVPSDDYWILIQLEDGQVIKDHITLKR